MSGQQKRAVRDIIATLAERFPACFSLDRHRKPLKVGIHDEVLAALPDVPAKQVGLALRAYTSNPSYLHFIREGAPRVSALTAK
jgi:ProP effector